MNVPLTSISKDVGSLTLTVVGDYPVARQRLWDAFADPRKLERFWGPPQWPATFTRHDFKVGGTAEYFMSGPDGQKWHATWLFTAVDPPASFAAADGDGDAEEGMPSTMVFTFDETPAGSRLTVVTGFSSVEAMERAIPGMEAGMRAAMPQLDAVLRDTV